MIAASAFFADGGSCFATTVKMYDAASAGVRFAKTGPDWRPSDCTATCPRAASAAVSGCQPELTEVAVAALPAAGRSTRAYQYHSAMRQMMMTRQPALFRQPFMAYMREGWGRIPRQVESGKGGADSARCPLLVAGTPALAPSLSVFTPQPGRLDAFRHLGPLRWRQNRLRVID